MQKTAGFGLTIQKMTVSKRAIINIDSGEM